MLKRFCLCFALATSFAICSYAQPRLGFTAGFSTDINNNGRFRAIPLSVQWLPAKAAGGSFLLKADFGIPLQNKTYDSAYTLAAGLPSAVAAEKTIRSSWLAFSAGYRFRVAAKPNGHHFFIDVLPLGISSQNFTVSYRNSDKNAYDVLNPDVGIKRAGLIFGCGLGYHQNNFVTQLHLQTPPTAKKGNYSLSYRLSAPLQLGVGYLLPLHKPGK